MIPLLPIALPLAFAALALAWRNDATRPVLLPAAGVLHLALCVTLLVVRPAVAPGAWLGFDAVAAAMLPAVSLLFALCGFYAVAYLRLRAGRPNKIFVASLLAVLGLLSAGHQARQLGVLWVAVEAVTLATVPLLHFNRTPRAYEATWKYLLVCATGVALSLLGSFFLGYASLHGGGRGDVTFTALVADGPMLSKPWVVAGWVLLLVGYGTKMGLAPMHTWKPDAYGETSGIVGAILAGGVTSVAFSAILRVRAVVDAAGEQRMTGGTLAALGLFSIGVAALFLLRSKNYKRLLAYSSVEHMGILCVGAALGPAGTFASLFHLWANAITKGALFMAAGNIHRAAGSASITAARGMRVVVPRSSALLVTGMFAIAACPPFAPFFSELRILVAAFSAGRWELAAGVLAGVFLAFLGMSRAVFAVVDGCPRPSVVAHAAGFRETAGVFWPPLALLGFSLLLGVFGPALLSATWNAAVAQLFQHP
jgi:hydrogenase-4 component F